MLLRNVFEKTLRDRRRALTGWTLGLTALIVVEGALWPSVRDMPGLDEFLAQYPAALRKMFNLDQMSSGTGFLNAELFTLMLPMAFIAFGISHGARLVAGEEEAGTLEVLLVTPVSTSRILLEKAAGLLAAVVLLGLVTCLDTLVASAAFGLGISPRSILVGSLSMVLMGLEFGWLALAVGAMTGRRAVPIGVASVAAMAAYVLYVAGLMVDSVHPWIVWSPFHQALAAGPLDAALPARFGWLLLPGAVALALSLPVFARRDIAGL